MKRAIPIMLLILLCLPIPGMVRADDTEIYGGVSISVEPNILIIFDTSGSMTTMDVPGTAYDPGTTYSGSYKKNVVYEENCGWGCSYDLFASNVNDLNCASVISNLQTTGYNADANVYDSSGSYNCGGSAKDLYLGNWLNYDETVADLQRRTDVAKQVITDLINTTDNVRFGIMRLNSDSQGGSVLQENGASKADLLSTVAGLPASGGTPLAESLAEAGLYFAGKSSWFNSGVSYTSPMQYRCQKNYVILMTDGEPTSDDDSKLRTGTYINGDTIGDYDNDGDDGAGSNQYLDDVATYLFENDLSSTLGTTGESFERQNIVTYTIGFKTQQTLLQETALRGGGEYYTANTAGSLKAAFEQIIASIADVNAVFVSPVVPVSRMNRTYAGNKLYVGFFKPDGSGRWQGNIKKYGLDSSGDLLDANGVRATLDDGSIKDNAQSYWSTESDGPEVLKGGIGEVLLDDAANRNLYTYLGTESSLTHSDNEFSTGNTELTATDLGDPPEGKDDLITDIHGTARDWVMGDILHSEPVLVHYDTTGDGNLDEAFIFAGGNDGIMHSFRDSDGVEMWGFIPREQLDRLQLLTDNTTDHDYFADAPPQVYEGTSQKILFFGERRGGDNYYALDVTTYDSPSWLYKIASDHLVNEDGDGNSVADGTDATLGQSWTKPQIDTIKNQSGGTDTIFLMAGGYDTNQDLDSPAATDTLGRAIYSIKVSDGTVSSLNVNAGHYANMTHSIVDVAGFDSDVDDILNRVYAGDMKGQIFAIEDDDKNGTWVARKLFDASAVDAVQRKIFYAPDAVAETTGETIYFGTGDRADPEETGVVNRVYAVKNDWEDIGAFTTITESDLVDVTDNLIQLGTDEQKVQTQEALDAAKGWYIRLENSGEKVTAGVTVFGGAVYFTTYTPEAGGGGGGGGDPCEAAAGRGTARLYVVDFETGEAVEDLSDVEETDAGGTVVKLGKKDRSKVIGTSIPSAPVIAVLEEAGPRVYLGVEGGVAKEDTPSMPFAEIYYWRQIID